MFNLLMAPMGKDLQICKIRKGRGEGKGHGKGLGLGPHDGRGCGCGCEEHMAGKSCVEDSNQDRHLTNLGFVEGAKISVVSESNGNLIVKVKDSKLAIGKDIAKKIMVTEI